MTEFDRAVYQREKIRRLEQEVEGLKRLERKLIQMLALACEIATGKTEVAPTALCGVIEELVEAGYFTPRQDAA